MQPMAMPAIAPFESPSLLLLLPEDLLVLAVEEVASSPAAFFAVPLVFPEVVVVPVEIPVEVVGVVVELGYASSGAGLVETDVGWDVSDV